MRRNGLLLPGIVLAALALAGCAPRGDRSASLPAPTVLVDEEEHERLEREAWLDRTHRTPDGSDWRTIEARTRARLAPARVAAARAVRNGGAARAKVAAALGGTWTERGSTNQAGRIVGSDYDPVGDRYYAYAHGGTVWSRPRAANEWQVLNDAQAFRPDFLIGGFALARSASGATRLVVLSGEQRNVAFSDDGGATWATAAGLETGNSFIDVERLSVRGDASGDVYVTRTEFDGANVRSRLHASSDRGTTFAPVAWLGDGRPVGLFAPRERSADVFVLENATLYRIEPRTHALVPVSTVPIDFEIEQTRHAILTGGVADDGRTFLYAFFRYNAVADTRVYRSLDGGATWTKRTTLPQGQFTLNSIAASARDPNVVIAGSIDAMRTDDGAESWQNIGHWPEYYTDPATKLHADVPDVRPHTARDGTEHFLIATDGGLYVSADAGRTVSNLSLTGLRNSEYYAHLSARDGSGAIVAGAQDQGLQKALDASGRFVQQTSGDYGPFVTGDGGRSAWTSYPGFILHDTDVTRADSRLDTWPFRVNGVNEFGFLSPLSLASRERDAIWVGGVKTSGYRIVELAWTPEVGITGGELPFDFTSPVTATAMDPFVANRRYAITFEDLLRSDDAGATWQALDSNFPFSSSYFSVIRPDPEQPGRIYFAGTNYAPNGVVVSEDHGTTTTTIVDGLPPTNVYDLAVAGDTLYAATEAGAFRFDRATRRWTDITLGAPDQAYWSVEWLAETRTARFATHGRGIWDFTLDDAGVPIHAGMTGLWFEAAKPGQGLAFEIMEPGGTVFASWYTYDAGTAGGAERQRWYSLQGSFAPGATSATLTVLRNVGGNFDAPPETAAQAFGTATLRFTSCTAATLAYSLTDGRTGVLQLARLLPNVLCSANGTTVTPPAPERNALWSGHWYRPGTGGQGFGVELNPRAGALFMAWFTYAPDGSATGGGASQRWYSIQTSAGSGQSTFADAPIFETTGGMFESSAAATTRRVGTATVTMGCSTASVDYAFDGGSSAGRVGRMQLVRVGTVPSACRD